MGTWNYFVFTKLFYIQEQDVDDVVKEMPADLPEISSTMRLHQVYTSLFLHDSYWVKALWTNLCMTDLALPGDYSMLSITWTCSANGNLECNCQKTKSFSFNSTDYHTEDLAHEKKSSGILQRLWVNSVPCCMRATSTQGAPKKWMRPTARWNVCTELGENCFFWPLREDVHWYPFEDMLTIIPLSQNVT